MRFRKLRIAFLVTCANACVLLCAWWMWSYTKEEQLPSFGRSQVELFILDRPGVGDIINREPALRALLESGFTSDLEGSASIGTAANQYPQYRNDIRRTRTFPAQ